MHTFYLCNNVDLQWLHQGEKTGGQLLNNKSLRNIYSRWNAIYFLHFRDKFIEFRRLIYLYIIIIRYRTQSNFSPWIKSTLERTGEHSSPPLHQLCGTTTACWSHHSCTTLTWFTLKINFWKNNMRIRVQYQINRACMFSLIGIL